MASLPIAKLYKIFITPSLGPLLSSSVPRPSCFRRVLGCVVGLGAVAVAGGDRRLGLWLYASGVETCAKENPRCHISCGGNGIVRLVVSFLA